MKKPEPVPTNSFLPEVGGLPPDDTDFFLPNLIPLAIVPITFHLAGGVDMRVNLFLSFRWIVEGAQPNFINKFLIITSPTYSLLPTLL